MVQFLTNWAGDDGFVHKTHIETRKFFFIGDSMVFRGRVNAKRREGNLNMVDIEISGVNQLGEMTTPASAVVLLPSREFGPVQLPNPPDDVI
jgi:hypothetical protein